MTYYQKLSFCTTGFLDNFPCGNSNTNELLLNITVICIKSLFISGSCTETTYSLPTSSIYTIQGLKTLSNTPFCFIIDFNLSDGIFVDGSFDCHLEYFLDTNVNLFVTPSTLFPPTNISKSPASTFGLRFSSK